MKKFNRYWKSFIAAGTAIILFSAVLGVLDPYRFWAWASDLDQVAELSYGIEIRLEQENLRGISLSIDKCHVNRDCPDETLLRLKRQEQDSQDKIKKLKDALQGIISKGEGG